MTHTDDKSATEDERRLELKAIAGEVAGLLIQAFGSPNAAEAVLASMIKDETNETMRDFWAEVIIGIAERRG